MDIHPTTSEYAHWPVTADVDLGAATFEVYLNGSWQAAEWVAAAVQTGPLWSRTARLKVRGDQGGSDAVPILTTVIYPPTRIITADETIVRPSKFSFTKVKARD